MSPNCRRARAERGFSLLEVLAALTIAVLVVSAVFAMLDPAGGGFQTQPEAADVQQRLRATTDVLFRELLSAGGTPSTAGTSKSTTVPGLFPFRIGRRGGDPPGAFDASRISVWSVGSTAPQARVGTPLPAASGAVSIVAGPGCLDSDPTCGFRSGATLVAIGPSGAWDLYSIAAVQGTMLTLQHNLRDAPTVYPAGETIVAEATARTYFLRDDRASGLPQLMRYDGAAGADVPVVDHVARLVFEYYGASEPPAPVIGADPTQPPRSTYGPDPPAAGTRPTAYPAGENCVFARTPGGAAVSRLLPLGAGPALVPLDPSLLIDGPWCPDALSPNRYDADLLRVRQVVVSITVEAAVAALRGPAGPLFTRAGTARGNRFVPDRTARLVVAPRAPNARQ